MRHLFSSAAIAVLAACSGAARPATVGTYCFNCQGVNKIVLDHALPADPRIAKLELAFVGCPAVPATIPLSFEGLSVKIVPRAGVGEVPFFDGGELQLEECDQDHVRGSFWLGWNSGEKLTGRVDGALRMQAGD